MSRQSNRLPGSFTILAAIRLAHLMPRSLQAEATQRRIMKNSYGNINWDRIGPFIANWRAHMIYRDGRVTVAFERNPRI